MKIQKICLALGLGLSLSICTYADITPGVGINVTPVSAEHVVWQGTPIAFSVPVGEERLISFPGEVSFKNMDPSLTSDKVSITNNNGTLYIRALQQFDPIRTYVEIKSTGQIVYLDLSGQNGGDDTQVNVVTPSSNTSNVQAGTQAADSAQPNYLSMVQYGLAQLYWPERLFNQLNNDPSYSSFSRTPMHTSPSVHLIMGNNIIAMPQVSWRNGDLFVTEVLLINPNKQSVNLDPFQDFVGDWQAKAFYPTNYLTPQGTPHDRTVVLLVSDQPFNGALNASVDYR